MKTTFPSRVWERGVTRPVTESDIDRRNQLRKRLSQTTVTDPVKVARVHMEQHEAPWEAMRVDYAEKWDVGPNRRMRRTVGSNTYEVGTVSIQVAPEWAWIGLGG